MLRCIFYIVLIICLSACVNVVDNVESNYLTFSQRRCVSVFETQVRKNCAYNVNRLFCYHLQMQNLSTVIERKCGVKFKL